MSQENEVIVVNSKQEMAISSDDVTRVGNHLSTIKEFVSSKMNEGIDRDYAVIPGTRTKSLLQPGAQKLMNLFSLGVRYESTEKEFDRYEGFALYSYKAEIYHLQTGTLIAQCEGTANSQEKKYKKMDVCDILNTLKKMAQKRAMVGAVITAVGASDYFSQDEDEIQVQNAQRGPKRAETPDFNGSPAGNYKVKVGKFKNSFIKDLSREELTGYLDWVTKNNDNPDGPLKEFVDRARDFLRE